MKNNEDVIDEFNEVVNMTASELEKWLKSGDSNSAGWPKEDEGGETVGHDSGRKIVDILKSNPKKEPKKYTEDQIQHMRKVVSYCKRHLAQEKKVNEEKSDEEVKKTKSYASLKNWGHDFLKAKEENETGNKPDQNGDAEDEEVEQGTEVKAGEKRKKASGDQKGAKKKQETRQTRTTRSKKQGANGDDEESEGGDEEQANGHQDAEAEDEDEEADGADDQNGSKDKAKNGPDPGDEVTWKWGAGHPKGKVLDVKEEKTTITTKKGNQVSRDGDEKDPAVVIDTGKSKAVKASHELD